MDHVQRAARLVGRARGVSAGEGGRAERALAWAVSERGDAWDAWPRQSQFELLGPLGADGAAPLAKPSQCSSLPPAAQACLALNRVHTCPCACTCPPRAARASRSRAACGQGCAPETWPKDARNVVESSSAQSEGRRARGATLEPSERCLPPRTCRYLPMNRFFSALTANLRAGQAKRPCLRVRHAHAWQARAKHPARPAPVAPPSRRTPGPTSRPCLDAPPRAPARTCRCRAARPPRT